MCGGGAAPTAWFSRGQKPSPSLSHGATIAKGTTLTRRSWPGPFSLFGHCSYFSPGPGLILSLQTRPTRPLEPTGLPRRDGFKLRSLLLFRLLRKWSLCSHLGDVRGVKLCCCCGRPAAASFLWWEELQCPRGAAGGPLPRCRAAPWDFRDRVRPVRSFAWLLLGPSNLWARGVRVIWSLRHIL